MVHGDDMEKRPEVDSCLRNEKLVSGGEVTPLCYLYCRASSARRERTSEETAVAVEMWKGTKLMTFETRGWEWMPPKNDQMAHLA